MVLVVILLETVAETVHAGIAELTAADNTDGARMTAHCEIATAKRGRQVVPGLVPAQHGTVRESITCQDELVYCSPRR